MPNIKLNRRSGLDESNTKVELCDTRLQWRSKVLTTLSPFHSSFGCLFITALAFVFHSMYDLKLFYSNVRLS